MTTKLPLSLAAALVVAFLVAGAVVEAKKTLYHTNLMQGGFGRGTATILFNCPGNPNSNCPAPYVPVTSLMAKSYNLAPNAVTKVYVTNGTWAVGLCDGDCPYDGNGQLDLDVDNINPYLIAAGVTGGAFKQALDAGGLVVVFEGDGLNAAGAFARMTP